MRKFIEGGIRHAEWVIFCVALMARLVYILTARTYLSIEQAEVVQVARSLADFNVFGNAFGPATGPTAHVAPVYPFLLSLIYRAFGYATMGQVVQEVFSSVVSSAQFTLLPSVAVWGGLGRRTGVAAGLLGAALPLRLWMETKGSWESSISALAFIVVSWATLRAWQKPEGTWTHSIGRGVLWGIVLLTAPALLAVFVPVLAVEWFVRRSRGQWGWGRHALVCSCGLVLTVLPWIVRNYRQFGGFFWIRSNFGLELSVSNNALAGVTQQDNVARWGRIPHPFSSAPERLRLMEQGELGYNRERLAEAMRWIRQNPKRFAELTAGRVWRFWFPAANHPGKAVAYGCLVMLAFCGLAQAWRRNAPIALWITLAWVCFPAMYYLVQADPRYPYPLHWTFLVMAAFVLPFRPRLDNPNVGRPGPSDP